MTDVTKAVDTHLINSDIPKKIVGVQCLFNGTLFDQIPYEDSVLPGRKEFYRIHPFYMRQQPRIHVQVLVPSINEIAKKRIYELSQPVF